MNYPEQTKAQDVPRNETPIFTVAQIAEVCHEANRALQRLIGDDVSPPWQDAPLWQRESALEGVKKATEPPKMLGAWRNEQASHDSWLEKKLRDGWRYGAKKDAELKTHPCLLPYEALPLEQKAKDGLFLSVINALAQYRR